MLVVQPPAAALGTTASAASAKSTPVSFRIALPSLRNDLAWIAGSNTSTRGLHSLFYFSAICGFSMAAERPLPYHLPEVPPFPDVRLHRGSEGCGQGHFHARRLSAALALTTHCGPLRVKTLGRRHEEETARQLIALAAVALSGGAGSATASPAPPNIQEVAQPITTILSTAIDPLITDVAVTDDQLLSAGVTVNSIPALLAEPDMLIVDDDLVQCPNAQFTSIQAAVLFAPPGATIRVCPGEYHESVVVAKPLTLQAPRHQGQATECMTPTADDPSQEAIVLYNASLNGGNPSEGFDVEASNVTIDGFKVEPDTSLVTANGVGIFTSRFHAGYDIRHNVVQNNTFGIYVNSDGSAPSYVRENCLRNNNLPGAASGNGVYSDQGLSNAQITNNYFTGDQNPPAAADTFRPPQHAMP